MLVVDTSAFVSLATGELVARLVEEFDVHTTGAVVDELSETAAYDDPHGRAAARVLDVEPDLTVAAVSDERASRVESSRIDRGEGSCVVLAREIEPAFFLTDDFRALPELGRLVDADVTLSPVVLRAFVERGVLSETEAAARLDRIAETRDWLETPIYERGQDLLDG
jgi:predicted nucleic acid-binding protein